jgi:hypothetical protein
MAIFPPDPLMEGSCDGKGADTPGNAPGLWWDGGRGEVESRGESGNYHHKYGSVGREMRLCKFFVSVF